MRPAYRISFAIGGLSYRRALNPSFALAPFIQSVLFDGGGALTAASRRWSSDRLTSRRWRGDLSLPLIGLKALYHTQLIAL